MANFFKKLIRTINPLAGAIVGGKGDEERQRKAREAENKRRGAVAANQEELAAEEGAYKTIPQELMTSYLATARKAGTYGDTPEFGQGLQSEVEAGARGARVSAVARINALRKKLGMDEFKPEGYAETQANETKGSLIDNPAAAPSEAPAPEAQTSAPEPEKPVVPQAANAAATVQAKKYNPFRGARTQPSAAGAPAAGFGKKRIDALRSASSRVSPRGFGRVPR